MGGFLTIGYCFPYSGNFCGGDKVFMEEDKDLMWTTPSMDHPMDPLALPWTTPFFKFFKNLISDNSLL